MSKYVTLYGGFHNAKSTRVRLNDSDYEEAKGGGILWLDEYLTESQIARLDRHFCGIRGCCCNGFRGATIEWH